MEFEASQRPRVAILPTSGMGHLIPLVELAKKLVHLHNFTITFIIPDDDSPIKPQKAFLENLHPAINSIFLPLVHDGDSLPEDAKLETRILSGVFRCLPSLRIALSELSKSTRVSALIVDMFGLPSFDVAQEFGIPFYIFSSVNAMVLALSLHLLELDKSSTCEYRDLPEPVKLPGCVPIHGSDLPDPFQDRKNEAYKACLQMCHKFTLANGILVNSSLELEPAIFKALEQQTSSHTIPPIYPVGPLTRSGSSSDDKVECLKWLDKQPPGSVLFVSFGSGGTLSSQQLNQLALGLEMSEQRFLLVARIPNDKSKNAAYFGAENKTEPAEYLPTGFMERTKEKGFVLSQWAPQIEVLSHAAVGGFLTHCGWNSALESIVHGVPLVAWPLYAEQRTNAVLLSEDLKVAFRVRENENGLVDSEQISSLARELMEGEEGEILQKRMRNLKDAAAAALSPDGSSTQWLAKLAEKWISDGS